jgi:cell division protein ZipA
MDKELLRLIIIATGAVVIVGIILWSFFQNKRSRRKFVFRDDSNALNNIDKSLIINTADDDFDIVPLGSAVDKSENEFTESNRQENKTKPVVSRQAKQQLPKIIQLSIVAKAEDGFNGLDLVAAFDAVGLQYGSMQIFERIDADKLVDFGVASMVEPGTFPEHDLHTFNCPGIAFFMQPQEVDDPLAVFDDFIETLHALSFKLDGIEWDEQRQPLSEEKILAIRNSISS